MMPPRDNDFRFAEFVRIVDGDTFQARIHVAPKLRPRTEVVANVRVHNWDAKELNTDEGRIMRRKFEELLMTAGRIDLQLRTMSFERIVCSVFIDGELFAGLLTHELLTLRRDRAEHSRLTTGIDATLGHPNEPSSVVSHPINDERDR